MNDLIDRQAAIDALNSRKTAEQCEAGKTRNWTVDICVDMIKQLPPIQPERGKWIHHPEIGWGETWLCDQCGEKTTSTVMGKPRANFCPNCGSCNGGEQDDSF